MREEAQQQQDVSLASTAIIPVIIQYVSSLLLLCGLQMGSKTELDKPGNIVFTFSLGASRKIYRDCKAH